LSLKDDSWRKAIMYLSDAKKCAQQIVKEFFADILIGEFQIPSQKKMESYLLENIDYSFDEYQTSKKIQRSHLKWSKEQITTEFEMQKRRYEKEFRDNLKVAAQKAVNEVENLVSSLKDAIKVWRIKNLE
jgi:molecular chaperone GrpE (heat shock protein)